MFCKNCGTRNPNIARFCENCGLSLLTEKEKRTLTPETSPGVPVSLIVAVAVVLFVVIGIFAAVSVVGG